MKKLHFIIILLCLFSSVAMAQMRNQRPIPQNTNPEAEKARFEAEAEKQKQKYISDFVSTLKVDDFQKEIIKQTMNDYFDEVKRINEMGLPRLERANYIEKLDARHFQDIEAISSKEIKDRVVDAVKGRWDQKEDKKKKKKEKKKKKKKKNKSK